MSLLAFNSNDGINRIDQLGLVSVCGQFVIEEYSGVEDPERGRIPGFQVRYLQGKCECKGEVRLVQATVSNAASPEHFDASTSIRNRHKETPGGLPPPAYLDSFTKMAGDDGAPKSYLDSPFWDNFGLDTSFRFEVCAVCRNNNVDALLGCATFSWTDEKHVLTVPGGTLLTTPKPQHIGKQFKVGCTQPTSLWNTALKRWQDNAGKVP